MSEPTFKALELDGWTARAQAYDDWLAPVTRQAIEPILAALGGELTDRTLLDICTGTEHLAGAAAAVRQSHREQGVYDRRLPRLATSFQR